MPKPKSQSSDARGKKVKDFEAKIQELTEALQRERADAENIRRRHTEEIAGLQNHVKAKVVRDLLPVIDNFERALKHVPEKRAESGERRAEGRGQMADQKLDDWVKGVVGIKAQFEKTLENMGVERIKTVGEVFNPHLHEAISMEDDGGNVEMVSDELQPGYTIGDDVVRHAMVKVKTEKR